MRRRKATKAEASKIREEDGVKCDNEGNTTTVLMQEEDLVFTTAPLLSYAKIIYRIEFSTGVKGQKRT